MAELGEVIDTTLSKDSSEATTAVETPTTATPSQSEEFDAERLEVDFGMAPGTLSEAKDEASAMEIIRQHADRILSAGFTVSSPATQTTDVSPKTEKSDMKPVEKPAEKSATDIIMERLDRIEGRFQQAEQSQFQQMLSEVDRRIIAEVDKWESPKYGTSKDRRFQQLAAVKELRELVATHVAGYAAQGKQAPVIESVLRQVRAFHDADFKPTKKPDATDKKPLGTPGTHAQPTTGEARNIHEAYMKTGR